MIVLTFPVKPGFAAAVPAQPTRRFFLLVWRDRQRYRAMLRTELLPQPDSVLEDAGLDRARAAREAAKPVWRA